MISLSTVIALFLAFGLLGVSYFYFQQRKSLARFSLIIDLESEASKLENANTKAQEDLAASTSRLANDAEALREKTEREHLRALQIYRDAEESAVTEHNKTMQGFRDAADAFLVKDKEVRAALSSEYEKALAIYQNLQSEILVGQDSVEDMSFGIYQPHFTFETPEEYKAQIEILREQQKTIVRDGRASECHVPWTVNESKVEGKRMVRFQSKLMLRAFNGECEAAIANVTWGNAKKMEERIRKAFEAINKLGDVQKIRITDLYLMLKVEELKMTQELEQKRYEVKEEQRRIREKIRDEERTQKEIEDALSESSAEEERYAVAIAKARDEVTQVMGAKLEKLTDQISKFEAKLDEARQKKERAIARAQLTKSGFVYVISNIGSFGDRVFKIGMTRRLEPMERIYELSGASVPFPYDLHAMLFSYDAPALEHELHTLFKERRMNRVNMRREFFHGVGLEEVEAFVKTKGLSAQFMALPEAREYRQTLSLREALTTKPQHLPIQFPEKLFVEAQVGQILCEP